MKTIELIEKICNERKNEIIEYLETKVDFSKSVPKSIDSILEIKSIIELKITPLGEEIKLLIENSNEDKEKLDKEGIIIFEKTLSDIINKFF